MRARGLRIDSPKGNVHLPNVNAQSDPAAVGPVDVVFDGVGGATGNADLY